MTLVGNKNLRISGNIHSSMSSYYASMHKNGFIKAQNIAPKFVYIVQYAQASAHLENDICQQCVLCILKLDC